MNGYLAKDNGGYLYKQLSYINCNMVGFPSLGLAGNLFTLDNIVFSALGAQSCQVELSVMREISLLQYVKRGRNICKTRSALPEVARQPRMLGGPRGP